MKRSVIILCGLALLSFAVSAHAQDAGKGKVADRPNAIEIDCNDAVPTAHAKTDKQYVPVHTYDPARNADQDILDALAEAKRSNRRVMLEVGGLWCSWCRFMDEFFVKQPQVTALREKNFVMLKVNFSDENKNEVVLSRYPKIGSFPHIFILDAAGTLLQSQDTAELEEGKGYSVTKFTDFLKKWSASGSATAQK